MMTAIIIFLSIAPSYIVASTMSQFEKPHAACLLVSKAKQSTSVWRPARYRGLTMGKSTRADMLRVLGKPKWSETFDGNGSNAELWYHYQGKDIPGEIVVNVDKRSKVILRLLLYPKHLSKKEAIGYFGDDFITTRYELCTGFEDAESAPIYETPSGQFSYIEYRDKGIAISLDDHGKVSNITYVSEPIGIPSSQCKQMDKSP